MDRRIFLTASAAVVAVASCARMEKREKPYDEKKCPFCNTQPGICSFCNGTSKCSFCNGTGKRKNVTPGMPEEHISAKSYEETCPFCKGSGKCRNCKGTGKCESCKGTGTVSDWNFYDNTKKAEN